MPDGISNLGFNDDEPILSTEDLSDGKHSSAVKLVMDMMAPLGRNKIMVTLEALGTDFGGDRPGADFVTILDVSLKILELLKSAMKLLIGKLSSIDRLSIVILSTKPTVLCSLRQITESAVDDFETLINNSAFGPDRSITAGIQMALKVIDSRRFTTGRLAVVMLMSDATLNKDDYSTAEVQLGNIPVYAFALGKRYDPMVLNEISKENKGVTFFSFRNTDELRLAFSRCFILLFILVKEMDSMICNVIAGKHRPPTDNASSSTNIQRPLSLHATYDRARRLVAAQRAAAAYGHSGHSSHRPDTDKVIDEPTS